MKLGTYVLACAAGAINALDELHPPTRFVFELMEWREQVNPKLIAFEKVRERLFKQYADSETGEIPDDKKAEFTAELEPFFDEELPSHPTVDLADIETGTISMETAAKIKPFVRVTPPAEVGSPA